jgi:succinyl-CoA synthetase beta subunit
MFAKLYKCYMETDASLVEINPLILRRQRHHQGPGRQVQLRLQRPVPSPRNRRLRDLDEEDPPKSKPPSSIWPTSPWTATSAAW